MIRSISILLLIFGFILPSCKSKKQSNRTDNQTEIVENTMVSKSESMTDEPIEFLSVQVHPNYTWGGTDPFNILDEKVNGDTLVLTVEYGGGCEKHIFSMFTDLVWLKSFPPKVHLWLEHESNDDRCRALVRKTLYIDLSNVRYENSPSVFLILNGMDDRAISYSYRNKK